MLKTRVVLLTALALTLSGCAFGRKVDYSALAPQMTVPSGTSVAVAVSDERPYVLSGKKENTFVGVTRGGFYNPFDMNTVSKKPLAIDLQQSVLGALAKSNIQAVAVPYQTGFKADSASQRLLVLNVKEWKTDTYGRTRFDYNLNASVIDENGKVIGSKSATNSGAIDNFQHAGQAALDQVLASPEIVGALKR